MTRTEQLRYLIHALSSDTVIPTSDTEKWELFRSLVNIREPIPANSKFLSVQDAFLQDEIKAKGITNMDDLKPIQGKMHLWQGDITTLKVDAIVNAANSGLLGCFAPCHGCIDNAIHTYAGVQLRLACYEIMKKQGCPEQTGTVKRTKAFNLPSNHILHTVGPIVHGELTEEDCTLLEACYHSCLQLAEESCIKSVAFCCISTGEFHFPNEEAARIAVQTVTRFLKERQSQIEVIFNVFKDCDYEIYRQLLR